MVEIATDSTAPEQGQAASPEARLALLLGAAPPSEAKEDEEDAPTEDRAAPEDEAEGTPQADEAGEEQPPSQTFKVKVDGEEVEVGLDELLRGYSRHADYTRKTQTLSEERKALEAEKETARAERSRYEQALQWAETQLKGQMQNEPDWQKLLNEDPIEYVKQKEAWRDRKDQLTALWTERQRIDAQKQQEFQAALAKKVEEETQRLSELVPEWRDSKKAASEKARLSEYGKSLGFSEQELAQVYDHRAVLMLRKAMLYDELNAKGKQKLKEAPAKAPAAAKPGSPVTRQRDRDFDSAKARLKDSGSVHAAQDALERLFASR